MLSSSIAAHALLFAFCDGCEVRALRFSSGMFETTRGSKRLFSAVRYHCLFPSAREQGAEAL